MEEYSQDFFECLPDEVIQLIFSAISDCKSLVRCMSVSKAFRQQSTRVPLLSIVCPGNFSSYEERLEKIYCMVKGFQNLQSLVVRVGQPKEEPPSWARCMRYAEIGTSVEKFVFMAAKSGDFSEFDCALVGMDVCKEAETGPDARDSADMSQHADTDFDEDQSAGRSSSAEDLAEEQNTPNQRDRKGSEEGNPGTWSDSERNEGGQQPVSRRGEIRERSVRQDRIGSMDDSCIGNSGKNLSAISSSRLPEPGSIFMNRPYQRQQLYDFSLRQVIAPSNDVLRHMLPVIHFAIVQGLNELRDSIPVFIAKFPELRRFLLVDMVESITVHMREHHIQEIRALHLQDLSDWDDGKQASSNVEGMTSEGGGNESYGQENLCNHVVLNNQQDVINELSVEVVGSDMREQANGRLGKECEMVMTSRGHHLEQASGTAFKDGQSGACESAEDSRCKIKIKENVLIQGGQQENGRMSLQEMEKKYQKGEQESDTTGWKNVESDMEKKLKKGKGLMGLAHADGCLREKVENHSAQISSCSLWHNAESSSRGGSSDSSGKRRLSVDHNKCSQSEESTTAIDTKNSWASMIICDCNSCKASNRGPADESANIQGGISCGAGRCTIQGNVIEVQRDVRVTADFEPPSSGDSEEGYTDIEEYHSGSLKGSPGRRSGMRSHRLSGTSENSSHLRVFEKLIEDGTCDTNMHHLNSCNTRKIKDDKYTILNGDIGGLNSVGETDQLLHLRYVEGWDGRFEGCNGENSVEQDDAYRWRSCRSAANCRDGVREGRIDVASRHPFKRGLKNDNNRMRESNKNVRFGCSRRRDDYLVNLESLRRKDDGRAYRSEGPWRREEGRHLKIVERVDRGEEIGHMEDNIELTTLSHSRTNSADGSWGPKISIELEASSSCGVGPPCISVDASLSTADLDFAKGKCAQEISIHQNAQDTYTETQEETNVDSKGDVGRCIEGVVYEASIKNIERNKADVQTGFEGGESHDRLVGERRTPTSRSGDIRLENEQRSFSGPNRGAACRQMDHHGLEERTVQREAWRDAWRETWRERVRRLRDMRREAQSQGENGRDREARRERTREVLRKRQRDLEREALSFDYTFWRAEQVVAHNYRLSDVSMCIATHAARPLGEAEMEILARAALAGPLLVATVSHVNKQHTSHNL